MSKKPKTQADQQTAAEDAEFYKRHWLDEKQRERREWLRQQLVGWWACATAEFEAVQAELQNENSELHAAFTPDERWEMDAALETAWSEFSSLDKKPKCVPTFLKSLPGWIPTNATEKRK